MFYVVCYIVCQKENPVLKWEFWAYSHFPEGRAGTQTLFPDPWLMLNEGTGDSRSAAPKRLAGVSEEAARGRCFLTFAPGCSDPGDNHALQSTLHPGWPSCYQASQVKPQKALTFGLTHQAIQRWIFVSLSKNSISGLLTQNWILQEEIEQLFEFGNNLEEALVSWVRKTGVYGRDLTYAPHPQWEIAEAFVRVLPHQALWIEITHTECLPKVRATASLPLTRCTSMGFKLLLSSCHRCPRLHSGWQK